MRALRLALCSALVGAVLPLCAVAQPLQNGLPHLTREGWGFSCHLNKEPVEKYDKDGTGADACGQVGPLRLGMNRADAEKILGSPTTERSIGSSIFYVYSLQTDETSQMITYAVIGYDSERRVASIQLTGTPWSGAWTFADIKLGDPGKAVISRLGNPHGVSPSREEGAIVWDYLPWTFSFEIRGSVVSSIRVSD
ncbi:MAG TPA: outer membrane protein assembly factor BamE [Rhizomicrobium sp.]|nr:outer membrane protein assembly factor BamE [Rhizomicrobium sp.]